MRQGKRIKRTGATRFFAHREGLYKSLLPLAAFVFRVHNPTAQEQTVSLAALMQNPRYLSGNFNTGLIGETYPKGFNTADLPHDDPAMLIAVGAAMNSTG